jgi:hypothetical protein
VVHRTIHQQHLALARKPGESHGACVFCFGPVLYGQPSCVCVCECCGTESIAHQLCEMSAEIQNEQEMLEDGLLKHESVQ